MQALLFPRFTALAVVLALSGCGGSSSSSAPNSAAANESAELQLATECLASSPWLKYGEGLFQASPKPVPSAAATGPVSSFRQCQGSTEFLFAAGKADITGAAAGKIMMGVESSAVYTTGVQMRQFARTFIIASPCNGRRVLLMLTDTLAVFEAQRQAVLDRIAADPVLSKLYGPDNVMLSATHNHSGPGGQSHSLEYIALRGGHDPQEFKVTVDGMFRSIQQAHKNLVAHPESGRISLNQGELLGANKNRALPAYSFNTEAERKQYVDVAGNEISTNRLMTLLRLQRDNGKEVGSLNWFPVHATSDYHLSHGLPLPNSSDNKGYAEYLFERFKASPADSAEPFVSSFMQSEAGDVFSFLYFDNPELQAKKEIHLPPNEPSRLTVANGQAQLNKALALYAGAQDQLSGPVDYRFGSVKMDSVEVTDPEILASLMHPTKMDAKSKRTCSAALGVSFATGGDGRAPGQPGGTTPAGVTCSNPDLVAGLLADLKNLPNGTLPGYTIANAVGCHIKAIPGLNLMCHAEKPILLPIGSPVNATPQILPFQLIRLGNLAIIGLPWEITTMAGRRLQKTVLDVLKADGVDFVVISSVTNAYTQYLTTREEYAQQQYEGASNVFGPWTLAAVQQEIRRLALDMRDARANDGGPTPPRTTPLLTRILPLQGTDQAPPGSSFGAVVTDANASYKPGDTARAVFQASSPNTDLKTESSFLFVERKRSDGTWAKIAVDADPETTFNWISDTPEPQFNPSFTSTAEILWRIPRNTAQGTYRIRFESVANQAGRLSPYTGQSREFVVAGPVARCP